MRRFILICLTLLIPYFASADIFPKLEAQCGEAYDGLVKRLTISGLPQFDMVVVSDCDSPNTALNRSEERR